MISVGPKRLIEIIYKRALFLLKEKDFGLFLLILWVGLTSGNILQPSKSNSHKYCQSYKFTPLGPKRSSEKNFPKKAIFPVKEKDSRVIFLPIKKIRPHGSFYNGPQGIVTVFVQNVNLLL